MLMKHLKKKCKHRCYWPKVFGAGYSYPMIQIFFTLTKIKRVTISSHQKIGIVLLYKQKGLKWTTKAFFQHNF